MADDEQLVEQPDGGALAAEPGAHVNQRADQGRVEGVDAPEVIGRQVVEQGGAHLGGQPIQCGVDRLGQRLRHPRAHAQHALLDNRHQLRVGQLGGLGEAVLVVLQRLEHVLLAGVVGHGLGDVALLGDDHPERHRAVERGVVGQRDQVVELVLIFAAALAGQVEDQLVHQEDNACKAMRLRVAGERGHAIGELVGIEPSALGAAGPAVSQDLGGQLIALFLRAGGHLVEAATADAGSPFELLIDHLAVAARHRRGRRR